jgi:hypothetical protein
MVIWTANNAGGFQVFSGSRQRDFAKTGGWLPVWMWCSTPWVGMGITPPMRKMEGNLLSKRFTSSGTASGIFCVAGGTETEGSAIGETSGKSDLAVAGAIAVQANSTWLVSGATVILNFLTSFLLHK